MGYFGNFNASEGIKFMDERAKGEFKELVNKELHFADYDYIHGSNGDYAVMCFKELPETFYFGNAIITEALKKIDADNMRPSLLRDDVSIKFFERTSDKTKRNYWAFEFKEEMPEDCPF